jgi:hypothetical protein
MNRLTFATMFDAGQLGGGAWGGGLTGGTDLDGDGAPDLVFAAPFASSDEDTNGGSAYILFGGGAR